MTDEKHRNQDEDISQEKAVKKARGRRHSANPRDMIILALLITVLLITLYMIEKYQ